MQKHGFFFDLPHIIDGEAALILIILIFLTLIFYAIAVLVVWIVGTIFTLGAYHIRIKKYIIEIEEDPKQQKSVEKFINRLISEILKSRGNALVYSYEGIPKEITRSIVAMDKNYRLFFIGRLILNLTIVIIGVIEATKLIIQYFGILTISSETAWLFWRVPGLIFGLIGLGILLISELKIRNLSKELPSFNA